MAAAEDIRKEKMKLDHLIIANALAHNATCIYSHDTGLKKWANGIIDVKELPDLPPARLIQQSMFKSEITTQAPETSESTEKDNLDDSPF